MRLTHAPRLGQARRLARPGGSFCFTHFVEPQGEPKGSIVQPITRAALRHLATAAGMLDTLNPDLNPDPDPDPDPNPNPNPNPNPIPIPNPIL